MPQQSTTRDQTNAAHLRQRAEDAPSDSNEVDGYAHPGFTWLDDMGCKDLPLSAFFAKAGHVLSDEARKACVVKCAVWRECTIWAYVGNPDGKNITGGYLAALSPGQRKKMSLEEALAYGEELRANYANGGTLLAVEPDEDDE